MDEALFRRRLIRAVEALSEAPQNEADQGAAIATKVTEQVGRIDQITSTARSAWFAYLAVLGFTLLAVLGVKDADLIGNVAVTTLPIVNYDVRLGWFLVLAPVLLTLNFGYLHAYIEQAWYDLSHLPRRWKGLPVSAQLKPWLVIEFGLYVRTWVKGEVGSEASVNKTPLGVLGVFIMAGLLWLGGPIVVLVFWLKSMVLHDFLVTGALGLLLWSNVAISVLSYYSLHRSMEVSDVD